MAGCLIRRPPCERSICTSSLSANCWWLHLWTFNACEFTPAGLAEDKYHSAARKCQADACAFGQAHNRAVSLSLPFRYNESFFLLAWTRKHEISSVKSWLFVVGLWRLKYLCANYLFVAELLFSSLVNKIGLLKIRCSVVFSALRNYMQVTAGMWIICFKFVHSTEEEILLKKTPWELMDVSRVSEWGKNGIFEGPLHLTPLNALKKCVRDIS